MSADGKQSPNGEAPPAVPDISVQDLSYEYRPGEPVVRNVHLSASQGEFSCLLGPNGSGKTTLLRCLMGALEPKGGSVLVGGRPVSSYSRLELARLVAYVPQFPSSTFAFPVRELVLMGRFAHAGILGIPAEQDLSVANLAMQMTDTLPLAERLLDELSGGEAQRVMIARALAQQPAILLLDEPTSHLDLRSQASIHRMMQRLAHDWPMVVMSASHDINLAARFADHLILMKQGCIVASGTPREVIQRETLEETYGTKIELVESPHWPVPIVLPR